MGSLIVFTLLIGILYAKLSYPSYALGGICLMLIGAYTSKERNDFLKMLFSKTQFIQLRMIEGILTALPFCVVLLLVKEYGLALGLMVIAPVLSLYARLDWSIGAFPTPFGKYPFEFTSGIRKYVLLLVSVVSVFGIGLFVGNFNLALFCLFDVFMCFLPYYAYLEPPFFVWNHRMTPARFLSRKIKEMTLYSLPLPLAMSLLLYGFYPDQWLFILGAFVVGYGVLLTMLLAKYSSYPKPINLPQAILFCMGLGFPPMLVIIIIIFWRKSINRLKLYVQ